MISLRSLTPTVFSFLKWSPELILSSAAFPALQVRFPSADCASSARASHAVENELSTD